MSVTELLRRRHRGLEATIAAVEIDTTGRRARVVQLAEELVAHATVEQIVLYPYAEEILGPRDYSVGIERALDALVPVVGGVDDGRAFPIAVAQLFGAFESHVDGDEMELWPQLEALGSADCLSRMCETVEEFERALASRCEEARWLWDDRALGSPRPN
jgi:hypothetical protein